jgi:hypothetical protein
MVGGSVMGLYVVIVMAFCFSWIFHRSNFVLFWKQAALATPIGPEHSLQYVLLPNPSSGSGVERSDDHIVLSTSPPHGSYWGSNPHPEYAAYERRIRGELRNAQFGEEALLTSDGRVLLDTLPRVRKSVSFQMGHIAGVTYYHCSAEHGPPIPDNGDLPTQNIVLPRAAVSRDMILLNAQRFFGPEIRDHDRGGDYKLTDEQVGEHAWAQYCQSLSHTTGGPMDNLVALELDLAATPAQLRQVLRALWRDRRLAALPVAALVTPEAAAKTVLDWMVDGDTAPDVLRAQVARHWIPVSAGPAMLQALREDDPVYHGSAEEEHAAGPRLPPRSVLDGWPVLFVYGDAAGAEAAQRLGPDLAAAVALPGGRTCYLHYPEAFMAEVQRYLAAPEA